MFYSVGEVTIRFFDVFSCEKSCQIAGIHSCRCTPQDAVRVTVTCSMCSNFQQCYEQTER